MADPGSTPFRWFGQPSALEQIVAQHRLTQEALKRGDIRGALQASLESPMAQAFWPSITRSITEAKGFAHGLFEAWVRDATAPSEVASVLVAKNPSGQYLGRLLAQSTNNTLRFVRDASGDLYVWDAQKAIHTEIAQSVGLKHYSEGLIIPPAPARTPFGGTKPR